MKQNFLTMIIATLFCVSIVGCGKSSNTSTQTKNETKQSQASKKLDKNRIMKFNSIGLEYTIPETWVGKKGLGPACVAPGKFGTSYIMGQFPYEFAPEKFIKELMEKSKSLKTEEEKSKLFKKYQSKAKDFFTILVLDKSKENNSPKEDTEQKEKLFSKYKHKDKVAEKDNLQCFILYNDKHDESNLSDAEKKEFKEAFKGLDELKKSIKLFQPIDEMKKMENSKTIQFKTKTLDGKDIDSNIFKNNKLTMINTWATTCGPCVGEMQDIQKLYEEIKKENVNVIGIVADTADDEENQAIAKKILDKKGAKFTNIIPDEKLLNGFLKNIPGVPTTIFVDNKGNIIGKPIVGANSTGKYKQEIQTRLNTLK